MCVCIGTLVCLFVCWRLGLFFFKKSGQCRKIKSEVLIPIHRKAELKSMHAPALLCQKFLGFYHQLCFGENFTF